MTTVVVVTLLSRLVPGLLLLMAGISKALNVPWFVKSLAGYRLLPPAIVGPIAFGIIVLEVMLGTALTFALFLPWAAYGAAVLLFGFATAVIGTLLRHVKPEDCGCVKKSCKSSVTWRTAVRPVCLAFMVLIGPLFLSDLQQASVFTLLVISFVGSIVWDARAVQEGEHARMRDVAFARK